MGEDGTEIFESLSLDSQGGLRWIGTTNASTTVTDEAMRMAVFMVPTGTLSNPWGHIPGGASMRRKM